MSFQFPNIHILPIRFRRYKPMGITAYFQMIGYKRQVKAPSGTAYIL